MKLVDYICPKCNEPRPKCLTGHDKMCENCTFGELAEMLNESLIHSNDMEAIGNLHAAFNLSNVINEDE